jgi:hypothetical protein
MRTVVVATTLRHGIGEKYNVETVRNVDSIGNVTRPRWRTCRRLPVDTKRGHGLIRT